MIKNFFKAQFEEKEWVSFSFYPYKIMYTSNHNLLRRKFGDSVRVENSMNPGLDGYNFTFIENRC